MSSVDWFGTHRCEHFVARVQRAAHAKPEVHAQWQAQLGLLIKQAQALQQLSQAQNALLTQQQQQQLEQQKQQGTQPSGSGVRPQAQEPCSQKDRQVQEQGHAATTAAGAAAAPAAQPSTAMPAGGAEELLRAVFSVADTPSPEEIKALAWQTGCSRGHVRSFFSKLRSSVQAFLHRAVAKDWQQSKATDSTLGGTNDSEAQDLESHSAKLAAQLSHLSSLLDSSGAINMQAYGATAFVPFMKSTLSYEVREAQLRALQDTPAKVSYKLVSGPMLSVLDSWLIEGEADQQHKFVREILVTLQRLPVSWPLLQGSSLLHTAARFAAARNERTAAAAQQLVRYWGQRFDDLAMASVVQRVGAGRPTSFLQAHMPSVPRKREGSHRSGHSRRVGGSAAPANLEGAKAALAAAASGPQGGEAAQAQDGVTAKADRGASMAVPLGQQRPPQKQFSQPKSAHYSTKPTSVDDIRKMKQKQAAKGSLSQLRGGPGAMHTGPHAPASQPTPPSIQSAAGGGFGRGASTPGFSKPQHAGTGGGLVSVGGGKGQLGQGQTGLGRGGEPPHLSQGQRKGAGGVLSDQQQSQASQQQQHGRPLPGGAAQPPAAKRQALASDGGAPRAPAGMVLMEELQQQHDGQGGGDMQDQEEELPAEAVLALKQFHELKRQRQAHTKAAAVTADPALQKEIAKVITDYETKALQLEESAGSREEAAKRLQLHASCESMPSYTFPRQLPWHVPEALPASELQQVVAGEESAERAIQEERAARLPPVRYVSKPPPSTPAEPAETGARGQPPPLVPWLPLDPFEQETQNRRLWDSGVRLPTYAIPYPGAQAGKIPPHSTSLPPPPGPPPLPTTHMSMSTPYRPSPSVPLSHSQPLMAPTTSTPAPTTTPTTAHTTTHGAPTITAPAVPPSSTITTAAAPLPPPPPPPHLATHPAQPSTAIPYPPHAPTAPTASALPHPPQYAGTLAPPLSAAQPTPTLPTSIAVSAAASAAAPPTASPLPPPPLLSEASDAPPWHAHATHLNQPPPPPQQSPHTFNSADHARIAQYAHTHPQIAASSAQPAVHTFLPLAPTSLAPHTHVHTPNMHGSAPAAVLQPPFSQPPPAAHSGYQQSTPYTAHQPHTVVASQPPSAYAAYQPQYAYTAPQAPSVPPPPPQPVTSYAPAASLPMSAPAYSQPAIAAYAPAPVVLPQPSAYATPAAPAAAPTEQEKQAQALALLASNPSHAQAVLTGLVQAIQTHGGSEVHTAQLAQLQQAIAQHQQTQQAQQQQPQLHMHMPWR